MSATFIQGDCLEVLKTLPDCSAQMCVTSPPYYGLRDYGVSGQIGLEETPDAYIAKLVQVFREVKRVLKDDGTLFLNLGDSYCGNMSRASNNGRAESGSPREGIYTRSGYGLKDKDLIGIPWMAAFALRADGWYLRSDCIWAKPNPMPESVKDRPTKSHEHIFLFAKGQRKTRVIHVPDLPSEFVHFGQDLGLQGTAVGSRNICIFLATTLFNFAQRQENFSLPPFYSQEWQNRSDGSRSAFVGGLPNIYASAVYSAGFLVSDVSTKEFLSQIYRLGVTHANGNNFLVGGVNIEFPDPPPFYSYTDTSFSVNNSGQICEYDFVHNNIITHNSSGCHYYYDYEAILEPANYDGRKDTQFKGAVKSYDGVMPNGRPQSFAQDGHERWPSKIRGFKTKEQIEDNQHNGKDIQSYGLNGAGFAGHSGNYDADGNLLTYDQDGIPARNKRSVWTITTKPYKEAHFATFPEEIPETCIKAGSKPGDTVLDPFNGSGTTGSVAVRLGREYIGIELNPAYIELSKKRLSQTQLAII